jgi:hypothetical protein
MTRRSAAACGAVAVASLLASSGCCGRRPFLCCRGGYGPPVYNPAPAPLFPRLNAALTAGFGPVAGPGPAVAGPGIGGPVAEGLPPGGPDCVGCGAGPVGGPILSGPPPGVAGGAVLTGPPAFAGYPTVVMPQGYAQPGLAGPPSTLLNPPRVEQGNPPANMPPAGGTSPMSTPKTGQ